MKSYRFRTILTCAVVAAASAAVTSAVVSQDKGKPHQYTPEQLAEIQKMMELAQPGENHQLLAKKVGRWDGTVKMWWEAQGEPNISHATAEIKSLWNGRYFTESVEGEGFEPGQTFFGKSIAGYDNVKKKFFWVWIDNMGTGLMSAEGKYDSASKTFEYKYDYPDCQSGKYVSGRSVERWISNDKMVSEMYGSGPDGKEFKMMEITYTRAK